MSKQNTFKFLPKWLAFALLLILLFFSFQYILYISTAYQVLSSFYGNFGSAAIGYLAGVTIVGVLLWFGIRWLFLYIKRFNHA
ncbi:MAG: hypothetical protein ABIC95_03145 [archaeon]